MAKTLNAATDLFEPIIVNLWGPEYSVKQPTKKVERLMEAAMENIDALPEKSEGDDEFNAVVEVIDILLDPITPDGETKKTPAAKTHLKAKYKSEEIGIGHLNQLLQGLLEMRSERPT